MPSFPTLILISGLSFLIVSALIVPNEVQQPGTQPGQIGNLETPDKCDNCHGGYNAAIEPAFNWRGSMMANATRDPLFWATVAIAEQDFDGSGDLCIRCHTTTGWMGGRSTPTDGSRLLASDTDGVDCDTCHKMTNPNNSEHQGKMVSPFIANDKGSPAKGYFGGGMLSLWAGSEKLGPYANADARHKFKQSKFHRSDEFCGSCHDVSNPVVGDLAHNNGRQGQSEPIQASGVPGSPVTEKAAFRNQPFTYGVVERTFSEFKASNLSQIPVANYNLLPNALKRGAIKKAYEAALVAGTGGNYEDGTLREFTCQSCHMPPTTGPGCNKNGAPIRKDLPLHDMTGGNVWVPDAILYQNQKGTLLLGGGLSALQINAIQAGKERARQQLQNAAWMRVSGRYLYVYNLTGHKLISGYPEGRRMWLNIKWYDAGKNLIREDGEYGDVLVQLGGNILNVRTIKDLSATNTRIYEAHYGISKVWAQQLIGYGVSPNLVVSYDRITGMPTQRLSDVANAPSGTTAESFHFVLNNRITKDNRIPPYGLRYNDARVRNALPIPAWQYGGEGPGSVYRFYDFFSLNIPHGAIYATIDLKYQSTSWEYIQFLYLANNRQSAFLGNEGANLLDAWLNTGMAEPVTMASTTWGTVLTDPVLPPDPPTNLTASARKGAVLLNWTPSSPAPTGAYQLFHVKNGELVYRKTIAKTATSYYDGNLTPGQSYTFVIKAWNDANANGRYDRGVDPLGEASAPATATPI